jgi:hypothetical protein
MGVPHPGARLAQGVVLDFDPIKLIESHFPQCAQLVSLVAAYLQDTSAPWYVRQKTLVELSPAYAIIFNVECIESTRCQRISVGIGAPEIAPPVF